MAISNAITAILNFIAMMCSIPIMAAGIWLASKPANECIHWLRWPLVFLGVAFLLVSLTGFTGAYCKKEGLLAVYLVAMFILIILLLVLLVLAFVVSRPNGAYTVPGVGFKEYRLEGFSSWLRVHVVGNDNWGKSGCCKPPLMCGFQYSSPTAWFNPSNVAGDEDCGIWSNEARQLCYSCDSCKAGLLGSLREEWRKANIVLIITVVVLIWVYLIACSAYRNAQTEQLFRRYKRGWV